MIVTIVTRAITTTALIIEVSWGYCRPKIEGKISYQLQYLKALTNGYPSE